MHVTPYLIFDKKCGEAFRHYEKVLGGKNLVLMLYGDAPGVEQMPAEMKSQVIHASLNIGDTQLMGSDAPGDRYNTPQGFAVAIHPKTADEAKRVYDGLSDGGSATMPLQQTFFSPAFGMLTDKFGVPWMVNCQQ